MFLLLITVSHYPCIHELDNKLWETPARFYSAEGCIRFVSPTISD